MDMHLTIEGALDVRKALQELGQQAEPAVRGALYQEATALLNEADALVPRDTGNLAASKFQRETTEFGAVAVEVGYGGAASPYALAVHENPRSGKTGGVSPSGRPYKHWAAVGKWKYLETPFKAAVAGFTDRIAAFLRSRLLKGG